MTPEEAFALRLIAAEEGEREQRTDGGEAQPARQSEVIIIQRESFTASSAFKFNEPGTTMPIDGPGTLVEAVLVAQSEDFDIDVKLDGQRVVSSSFSTLRGRAGELERLSAYERTADGNFVFIASGYEFQQRINVAITPHDTLDVVLQRAEVDVVRGD